jgi:hypothetical protein
MLANALFPTPNRITPMQFSEDGRRIHRQALAGMLWTRQYYYFDLDRWLTEHDSHPMVGLGQERLTQRSVVPHAEEGHHLHAIIYMPDKWSTPGMRHGTWSSKCFRSRWWTSSSQDTVTLRY